MTRMNEYDELQALCNKAAKYADEHRLNLVPFIEKATKTIWFSVLPQEVKTFKKLKIATPQFIFNETSIGTEVRVREYNKSETEKDITDYSSW